MSASARFLRPKSSLGVFSMCAVFWLDRLLGLRSPIKARHQSILAGRINVDQRFIGLCETLHESDWLDETASIFDAFTLQF